MSTRIERRQSRSHVRRARWSGIIAGAGATMLVGLGAAGALPGVTVKATPPETPAAEAASATPGPAATHTLPAPSAATGAPGSVGETASAAGAANADANPTGMGQGAAISAAKSENAGVASTGANAATSLGSESTETGTARAVLQVGNENAQTAIQAAIDRAAAAPASGPTVAGARSTRARASSTSRAWGALPRGTNVLTVSGCAGTSDSLKTGTPQVCADIEGNLAVHFTVSATGEALTQGSVSFTLPAGTSLASLTPTASSEGTCSDPGAVTVSNGVVTISGVTCSQDSGYVWYFDATVGSTAGTYTLSGGYRTDDQPRNATNIYRLATDPTVTVV